MTHRGPFQPRPFCDSVGDHTVGPKHRHLQEHKLRCEEEKKAPRLSDPAVFLSLRYLYGESP